MSSNSKKGSKKRKRRGGQQGKKTGVSAQPVQKKEEQALEEQAEGQGEQPQWHHMAIVHSLEGLKRRIDVTYDTEAVGMAFSKAAEAVGQQVTIKGFRRGRAPKAMVESFCRKEIEQAASSMLSQEGYLHAVFENKLSPMSKPDVKDAKFHTDGTFTCSIFVEVRPDISLAGYIGLELEHPAVDEEAIIGQLVEGLREKYTRLESRETAEPEAMATVDYQVSVDGQVITEMESQAFMIMADGGSPLGTGLNGMAVGETREDTMALPADFGEHAGKEADVRITLRDVKMPVRPSDEELVEAASAEDPSISSMANLREKASHHAKAEVVRQIRQSLESQVVQKLLALHDFEVPQQWVDDEARYLLAQMKVQKPDEQVMNAVGDIALKNVKRTFIMEAIYEAEKQQLEVKPEELQKFITQEAARLGMPELALKRRIVKQNMMDSVVGALRNRKIMHFLIANANVTGMPQQQQPQVTEIVPPADEPAQERMVEILPPQD